jgi:hypothetical protein
LDQKSFPPKLHGQQREPTEVTNSTLNQRNDLDLPFVSIYPDTNLFERKTSIFEERFKKIMNPRCSNEEIRSQVVFEKQLNVLKPQLYMSLSILEEHQDLTSCQEFRKVLEGTMKELNDIERKIKEGKPKAAEPKIKYNQL